MIHLGKNTSSRIISKGIAAGFSQNTYRGLVSAHRKATNARNFTKCDSLLIGDKCGAHTVPYIEAKNATAQFEHEATTSKISDDQLFYCHAARHSRGGGDRADRQRLRQGRDAAAADGVRRRGAEADRHQPGRQRRLDARAGCEWRDQHVIARRFERQERMLEIKNLHARIADDGTEIIRGLNLTVQAGEVAAIMGPNGSGKSTLSYVLAGREDYEVTEGDILYNGQSILEMDPAERAAAGIFLAFQYPLEIPGVATMEFLKVALNAQRKARGEDRAEDRRTS